MPVKRREAKRRVNVEQEYQVWRSIFSAGRDFFDELPEIGLPKVGHRQVPADLARKPWTRFGARYLAEHPTTEPTWAEQQFGRPWETHHAEND